MVVNPGLKLEVCSRLEFNVFGRCAKVNSYEWASRSARRLSLRKSFRLRQDMDVGTKGDPRGLRRRLWPKLVGGGGQPLNQTEPAQLG